MSPVQSLLQRQVARASRRLFFQTLLDQLVWCWLGAVAVSAGWFLIRLYALGQPLDARSWAVVGGAFAAGAVLAVVLAFVRAPSRLAAALLVDERFGLKERVTTGLTLPAEMEATPAGQALLADVHERVSRLDVGERFGVRLRLSAALVPVGLVLLLLGSFFLEPLKSTASSTGGDEAKPPPNAAEIQQKMDELAKKAAAKKPEDEKDKSENLKQIEAELDKLVHKPHDTKEQLRERASELNDLEKQMKKQEKDLADKVQALKEQLKNLDKMSKKGPQEGPAKELEKALEKGDFKKARQEMEKLAEKLNDKDLSEEQKAQLAKQLEEMEKTLQRIAEQKDEEEDLKELARKGELSEDALQDQLDALKKKSDKLQDLDKLAQEMAECKECMGKGDSAGAAKALKNAANRLKQMGGSEEELNELADKLRALGECKN